MALISGDDLCDYLGLSSANENVDRLDIIASAASDVLCASLRRDWNNTSRTDLIRGNGLRELVLRHYPVTVLTSCTILNGSTDDSGVTIVLDVTDPTIIDLVNPEQGVVARTDGDVWTKAKYRNITITYVGGPKVIPGYVTLAALELSAWLYQTSGGRTNVRSGDTGVTFVNLAGEAAKIGFKGLPAVQEAIILAGDVL